MRNPSRSRGRRGYAPELKQRVLSRLDSGDVSLRKAAREFEISVPTLIKWRKEEKRGNTDGVRSEAELPRGENESVASELRRLRDEVERLKQERDRLRQGIAVLVGIKISQ
jgi:transposase-like protein